ncbi:hypothetical protein ABBQ38_008914 [Trebouxia sp. C0009 RCD-2024]
MGLASKVQAAGGATNAPSANPNMAAQSAASAFPQTNAGGPNGPMPNRPQGMPQSSQAQSAFPGQQSNAVRPSFVTQPSFGGQQPQQRPGQQPLFSGQPQQQQPFQQSGFASGQPGQGGQQNYMPGRPQQMAQQPGQSAQQNYPSGHPQQMGQQPRPSAQGPSANIQAALQTKIQNMIRTNRLETFYPPHKLQGVVQRLGQIDWNALAQRWNMPLELAYDLSTLALYDIVIYADDSGSMIFEEGGTRIDDLKLILAKVAEVATLFDDDGIVVRFMNSQIQGNGIRNAQEANNLIQNVRFTGMTPLGTNLNEKVISPFLASGVQKRNLEKPILVITITDGEPVGEPQYTVSHVIKNAKAMVANSVYGPGAIAFEFAQVGKDTKAQAFLGTLDNDPEIGAMIDATSYFELEAEEYQRRGVELTPELWLVKLMVGAVDPTYDESDEV